MNNKIISISLVLSCLVSAPLSALFSASPYENSANKALKSIEKFDLESEGYLYEYQSHSQPRYSDLVTFAMDARVEK